MGANPIYLRDQDVGVQVDPNGNVIYEVIEGKGKVVKQNNLNYTVYCRPVYVFTNAGEKVQVDQYVVIDNGTGKVVDNKVLAVTYTCHGNTFLKGQFVVNSRPEQAGKLLLDKGGFKPTDKLTEVVNRNFN